MTTKAYYLKNGLVLNTPAEIDAYIRGIELARITVQEKTEKETLAIFASALDDAHSVKSAGKTNAPKAEDDTEAAE